MVLSLACFEIIIRRISEEAINSTWNRIYSQKVFSFLLYRQSSSSGYLLFSTRVSDNLVITENQLWSQAIINAWKIHENSRASMKINHMLITRLISIKVYNTRPVSLTIKVLLIKILLIFSFRPLKCSLICSKVINPTLSSDRIRGPTCSRKVLNGIFPKLPSQNIRVLFPFSTISARMAWDHDPHLCPEFLVCNHVHVGGQ